MSTIHAVPFELQLLLGELGPGPMTTDVRSFVVAHATGVMLVDAGLPGSAKAISAPLTHPSAGGRTWPMSS